VNFEGDDIYTDADSNTISSREFFNVTSLGLSVTTDTSITDDDNLTADATANRDGPAVARLLDDDGDVEQAIAKDLRGGKDVEFDFGTVDGGNYSVEVTDNDTGTTVETDTIEVTEVTGDVSFPGSGFMTEDIGDVARIPVEFSNTDEATLVIGSDEQNYIAHVHVEDGDGEATVLFNTYAAGSEYDNIIDVADDDDSATLEGQHGDFYEDYPDDPPVPYQDHLETADYDMNVSVGHVALSETTDADAVGGLSLEERSTESIDIRTAPRGDDYSGLEAADVHARLGSNLTQSDEVASGDYAVHVIEASGIEGALEVGAHKSDISTTKGFLYGTNGQTSFTVKEANPGPNAEPDLVNLYSGSPQLVADEENDTYYLAVSTETSSTGIATTTTSVRSRTTTN